MAPFHAPSPRRTAGRTAVFAAAAAAAAGCARHGSSATVAPAYLAEAQAVPDPLDPFPNPKLAPTAGTNTNGARFGCSRDEGKQFHGGTDLKAAVGTEFVAIYAGRVTDLRADVSNDKATDGVGNYVIVRSTSPNVSIKYCHLQSVLPAIKKGAAVTAGDKLGATGRSGNAFGVPNPHLHVEVSTDHFLTNQHYVDPEPYLKTKYEPSPNPNPVKCPE